MTLFLKSPFLGELVMDTFKRGASEKLPVIRCTPTGACVTRKQQVSASLPHEERNKLLSALIIDSAFFFLSSFEICRVCQSNSFPRYTSKYIIYTARSFLSTSSILKVTSFSLFVPNVQFIYQKVYLVPGILVPKTRVVDMHVE